MVEPYQDTALPLETRADDLLRRMTLREKVGQLNQRLLGWQTWSPGPSGYELTEVLDEEVARWGGLGALYGLQRADAWSGRDWENGVDFAGAPELVAMVQEKVVAASRFGIPALMVEEAPHGHQALGSQLFPTNLGAAATFRPDLVEQAAAHTALELRARGAHVALVSGLDILRDPRWGRSEECFGEDPLLASLCTRALVRGMRGVAVVLKHFAGQGAGIGGRNSSGGPIGPRELAELHLPAARAGIEEGALGVMAAYNDIDGVPCVANESLLTDVLRGQWGFEGIVMADMFAVDRLLRAAPSPAAAGALALRAGVDLSMCDVSYAALEEAVSLGLVPESLVDRACRRVLLLKLRLGLLDPPEPLPEFPEVWPALALVAGTTVLLRNDGVLPLTAVPRRVAVLGPNADDLSALLGDYVPPVRGGATVLGALRTRVARTEYEPGCGLTGPIEGGVERAVALAAEADLAVLVLGGSSVRHYDDDFAANGAAALGGRRPTATTGEGFDAAEVLLPEAQRALAAAVAATGTPTVAVIVSGRPQGVGAVVANALLYAWYPGPTGGRAIADLVLGDREPTGRLPVSLPGSSGVLPVAYNERTETTVRYVDADAAAEFPFGHGLGYTTWDLGPATVEGSWPAVTVTAALRNTGRRRGTQVVQLYARARVPGLLPRKAVLVGFTHVTLDAGGTADTAVPVLGDALPGLGRPGEVDLWLSVTGAGEPVAPLTVSS
ncbi:beta-glucosidase [Asanoa ishikariensis]|uniref:Beta-glucosidase n=1 Tax=Asanoa ishikariensis TaxID=137265 RepID=A0A1H3UI33_9ACTN|nr:glycoside hydrolase family 3 N-terminal domain-containing protein [Asanoa ishikariensis]GIF63487.1 beta-glucosidase [Asanoa ishikariensis]SDZ61967.1 beta-glucosidase [Asanoa ishikariensis]